MLAAFEDLTLDVLAVQGIIISGDSIFEPVSLDVRYSVGFAVGDDVIPKPSLTISAVTCATRCPIECTTTPLDLDACLANIPAYENVAVTYVFETPEPSCATTSHVGVVIPVTGDILTAEFVAAEVISSGANTSAGVSADYACTAAASGAAPSVRVTDNTAEFSFTESLMVMENQLLAMTVDVPELPVTFAFARVTILGRLEGTMGASAASLLAVGTFSIGAYLATMF